MPFVENLAEAQGIYFVCPLCYSEDRHGVIVTFAGRGVPDHLGMHNKKGEPSDYNDLTIQPSIQLEDGCNWHGFITSGKVTTA